MISGMKGKERAKKTFLAGHSQISDISLTEKVFFAKIEKTKERKERKE